MSEIQKLPKEIFILLRLAIKVAGETLIETMKEFSIYDLDAIAGKIIEKSRNAMIAQIVELPEGILD